MSTKFMQISSLILAFIVAIVGAGGSVAVVAHYLGTIDTKVEQTRTDIADIKTTLKAIAPATVPAHPARQAVQAPAAQVAATSSEDPNDDTATWPARYLADHCKHCPECCASGATP